MYLSPRMTLSSLPSTVRAGLVGDAPFVGVASASTGSGTIPGPGESGRSIAELVCMSVTSAPGPGLARDTRLRTALSSPGDETVREVAVRPAAGGGLREVASQER